nr:MAG TPA: hypothetical protein [Caudoviricetes sp.]
MTTDRPASHLSALGSFWERSLSKKGFTPDCFGHFHHQSCSLYKGLTHPIE